MINTDIKPGARVEYTGKDDHNTFNEDSIYTIETLTVTRHGFTVTIDGYGGDFEASAFTELNVLQEDINTINEVCAYWAGHLEDKCRKGHFVRLLTERQVGQHLHEVLEDYLG